MICKPRSKIAMQSADEARKTSNTILEHLEKSRCEHAGVGELTLENHPTEYSARKEAPIPVFSCPRILLSILLPCPQQFADDLDNSCESFCVSIHVCTQVHGHIVDEVATSCVVHSRTNGSLEMGMEPRIFPRQQSPTKFLCTRQPTP